MDTRKYFDRRNYNHWLYLPIGCLITVILSVVVALPAISMVLLGETTEDEVFEYILDISFLPTKFV